jgi:hypothetical protein
MLKHAPKWGKPDTRSCRELQQLAIGFCNDLDRGLQPAWARAGDAPYPLEGLPGVILQRS